MNVDYTWEAEAIFLSEAQLQEVSDRNHAYEAGHSKSFSLDEIIAHFKVTKE